MADWTETHRPQTLSALRGNDSARDALREWAESWPAEGRAVILAGDPGTGKTSAAHALASDMGWELVEINASDHRTAETVEQYVGRASRNSTLGATGRQLVVVDEADSFRRSEGGGAQALADMIPDAGQPMVLIVNDEYEMPDSIRRSVDTIEFRGVSERSIVPALRDICRQEGIEFESAALETIAERNSGDLRSAINDLQAVAEKAETLTERDVVTGQRDETTDLWGYLDAVLKERDAETALQTTYEVDETPDDLLLWVEDKVPMVYDPGELATAYEFLRRADVWLGRVRATQEYRYWRYATDNISAGVAAARERTRGGFTRYGGAPYRSSRDSTRDYVARKVAETGGLSIGTARREVLPYLSVMTHHCRPRELTVQMAATYDLDESEVAFVTGSGETTNKVEGIVTDAREATEAAAVEASPEAFERRDEAEEGNADGSSAEDVETPAVETDEPSGSADEADEEDEEDSQAGLEEFF
ncbi:MAG: replication factor C large subunit [Halobacteriaceae archaeon]